MQLNLINRTAADLKRHLRYLHAALSHVGYYELDTDRMVLTQQDHIYNYLCNSVQYQIPELIFLTVVACLCTYVWTPF